MENFIKRNSIITFFLFFLLFAQNIFAEDIYFRGKIYSGYSDQESQVIKHFIKSSLNMNQLNSKDAKVIKKFISDVVERDYVFNGGIVIDDIPKTISYEVSDTVYSENSYNYRRSPFSDSIGRSKTVTRKVVDSNPMYIRSEEFKSFSDEQIMKRFKRKTKEIFLTLGINLGETFYFNNYDPYRPEYYFNENYSWSIAGNIGILFQSQSGFLLEGGFTAKTPNYSYYNRSADMRASVYAAIGYSINYTLPIELLFDFEYYPEYVYSIGIRFGTLYTDLYSHLYIDLAAEIIPGIISTNVNFKSNIGYQVIL